VAVAEYDLVEALLLGHKSDFDHAVAGFDLLEREDLLHEISWMLDRFGVLLLIGNDLVVGEVVGSVETELYVIGFGLEHYADDRLGTVNFDYRNELLTGLYLMDEREPNLKVQLRVWNSKETLALGR